MCLTLKELKKKCVVSGQNESQGRSSQNFKDKGFQDLAGGGYTNNGKEGEDGDLAVGKV